MEDSGDFGEKIEKIQRALDEAKSKNPRNKCVPMTTVISIAAPILIFIILYFLQPSFVQKLEDDEYSRSTPKVIGWTIFMSLIIWIGVYLYSYCKTPSFFSKK